MLPMNGTTSSTTTSSPTRENGVRQPSLKEKITNTCIYQAQRVFGLETVAVPTSFSGRPNTNNHFGYDQASSENTRSRVNASYEGSQGQTNR